jgi:hypothetical protein
MFDFRNLFVSKDTQLARDLVRFYFPGQDIKFKPEKNGTVRFSAGDIGLQGFYRIRKKGDRGLSSNHEDSFDQVHVGRLTIAVERFDGRDVWNFAVGATA